MSFKINDVQVEDLIKGRLSDLMETYITSFEETAKIDIEKIKNEFREELEKIRKQINAEKQLQAFQKIYGYKVPDELKEWIYISRVIDYTEINGTMIVPLSLEYYEKYIQEKSNDWTVFLQDEYFDSVTFFTGLLRYSQDGCGDTILLDLNSNENDIIGVYRYDHECGDLDGLESYSLASYIFESLTNDISGICNFDSEDFEELGELGEFLKSTPEFKMLTNEDNFDDLDTPFDIKKIKEVLKSFKQKVKAGYKKRNFSPDTLYERSKWLFSLIYSGNTGYGFANHLSNSPTFNVWKREKKLLKSNPYLIRYWMLAHYFLGNDKACREAIEFSKDAPGMLTKLVGEAVLKLLNDNNADFGNIKAEKLAKLREETKRNCLEEHFETTSKATTKIKKKNISKEELEKLAQEGQDLWEMISEYPEDIKLHDKILKLIAKTDKNTSLTKTIDRYFKKRTRNSFSDAIDGEIDERLSLPFSAAFRSGLKYNSDHKNAFAGITQTLGSLDDDNSINSYIDAINILKPDDDRLKYIFFENLMDSKNNRKNEVYIKGAERFFKVTKEVEEKNKEIAEEGPTLNNMFYESNYFQYYLIGALKAKDENSTRLANQVFETKTTYGVIGRALGYSFRVIADNQDKKYLNSITRYLEIIEKMKGEFDDKISYIEDTVILNLADACIALAKLDKENAGKILKKMFEKKRSYHGYEMDIKGAVLGGLLILYPTDESLINWAKRILSNRSKTMRFYGTINGIKEAGLTELKDYVALHLNDDVYSNGINAVIVAARDTLQSFGEKEILIFDEDIADDKYGFSLSDEDLPKGLMHPEKHRPKSICERIRKKELVNDDVIKYVGNYLIEHSKYSLDDKESRLRGDWIFEPLKTLKTQGPPALKVMEQAINSEYVHGETATHILIVMRTIEPEKIIRHWIKNATNENILEQLKNPSHRFLCWLDFLAAEAVKWETEEAFEAVKAAFLNRYNRVSLNSEYSYYDKEEATIVRLAIIFARFGNKAESLLQEFEQKYIDEERSILLPYIKKALEISKNPTMDLDNVNLSKNNEITLINHDDSLKYTLNILVKENDVEYESILDNFYFKGVIDEHKLISNDTLTFADNETAIKEAIEMAKHAIILGYSIEE